MNKSILSKSVLLILTVFLFSSCSDSDDMDSEMDTTDFAMTFMLNDELFEVNNPFGTNEFSQTNIFNAYPLEDFVLLQGRNSFFGAVEIDLWLKRDQIIEGATYEVNSETDETGETTHIDLIDNRNDFFEGTTSGSVSILSVDPVNKIVTGTFEFIAMDSNATDDTTSTVTEGTFNYIYE